MDINKIKDSHNKCADLLNEADLTNTELIATLAQLLIYTGQAITKKDIDVRDANFEQLFKEYYSNNKENDLGLGLILNGASIMEALLTSTGNVTADKEIQNDNLD